MCSQDYTHLLRRHEPSCVGARCHDLGRRRKLRIAAQARTIAIIGTAYRAHRYRLSRLSVPLIALIGTAYVRRFSYLQRHDATVGRADEQRRGVRARHARLAERDRSRHHLGQRHEAQHAELAALLRAKLRPFGLTAALAKHTVQAGSARSNALTTARRSWDPLP